VEASDPIIYLINNDLDMINEAIDDLEAGLEEEIREAINEGLHPCAAAGILYRIAGSILYEVET